ncbi:MAG: hypothetical protein FD145_345 [Candidatus Saganbacteria bacterium]|uniref:Outer membrane protein beta-barrel domain-containing protein n=1 Tax=Candidatus Saganbacteria bacterium TaxID=2575572 RepID=A0A833P3J8_UNCSA|nr:MAG: hypothetical protein FD145_345 [Candidatus Saganbacteria bacterium]
MKKEIILGVLIGLFFVVAGKTEAENKYGLAINCGFINNFQQFSGVDYLTGNILQVGYYYKFNNFYRTALEFAFVADHGVFKDASSSTLNVETASYLNLRHMFYSPKIAELNPYLSISTGLNAVNSWRKTNNSFSATGNNVYCDIGLGVGCDWRIWGSGFNLDFFIPAFFNAWYQKARLPYIFSFGTKFDLM